MTSISTLAGSSAIQQQNIKKTDATLLAAIQSLVSGKTQDVADVALATELQSRVAGLQQVSQNIAQSTSLTQVASGAIGQSQDIVDRLTQIALQSKNGTTSDTDRVALDKEFQSLVKELDSQVSKTQFNGQNLLDGSLHLSLNNVLNTSTDDNSSLSVNNLASATLFDGQSLNVLSADGATSALAALDSARGQIAGAAANVGSFQETLNYASASIDSAIINQQAAQSVLSDADFLDAATQSQQAQVQHNAQLALLAQGNRLPSALLQLVS